MPVIQIGPRELDAWLKSGKKPAPVLLDVREPWEFAICHIDGSLAVPMQSIPSRRTELDPGADTVVICHHGSRSQQVALYLEREGFDRLFNLSGGVNGWALEVDPRMPRY